MGVKNTDGEPQTLTCHGFPRIFERYVQGGKDLLNYIVTSNKTWVITSHPRQKDNSLNYDIQIH